MIPLVELKIRDVHWPPGMKTEGKLTDRRYKGCLQYKCTETIVPTWEDDEDWMEELNWLPLNV